MLVATLWVLAAADQALAARATRGRAVYYHRCDDARAAGAAPIRRGQPGYRPFLDADSDGIACEPLRRSRGGYSRGRRMIRRR